MKKIFYLLPGILSFILLSCNQSPKGEKVSSSIAMASDKPAIAVDFALNKEESTIKWEGYKPTGMHYGTVGISKGELSVVDGKLVGGLFEIDLNSIICLDLENENFNNKLVNHLKSEDFFYVEEYPKATFKITNVNTIEKEEAKEGDEGITPTHKITGNLTMRGTTKSITFPAKVEVKNDVIIAKTNQFVLDRTEWGVNFKSKKIFANLMDDFINDEMGIVIELKVDKV